MPPGLRAYLNHLRDPRTELSILVASALLVLVLAEPVLMSILEALAPAGYAWLQNWLTPTWRRWVIGLPPALLLAGYVLWREWRAMRSDR